MSAEFTRYKGPPVGNRRRDTLKKCLVLRLHPAPNLYRAVPPARLSQTLTIATIVRLRPDGDSNRLTRILEFRKLLPIHRLR
jgi:hypothetical protein